MQDFRALHKFLEEMNQSFQMHDQDRSGSLNSQETHSALTSAGKCRTSNGVVKTVSHADRTHAYACSLGLPHHVFTLPWLCVTS